MCPSPGRCGPGLRTARPRAKTWCLFVTCPRPPPAPTFRHLVVRQGVPSGIVFFRFAPRWKKKTPQTGTQEVFNGISKQQQPQQQTSARAANGSPHRLFSGELRQRKEAERILLPVRHLQQWIEHTTFCWSWGLRRSQKRTRSLWPRSVPVANAPSAPGTLGHATEAESLEFNDSTTSRYLHEWTSLWRPGTASSNQLAIRWCGVL